MAAGALYAAAAELLAVCVDALGATAPDRAYVAPSVPAIDCCPQLTVHVQQVADMDRLAPAVNVGDAMTHLSRGGVGVITPTLVVTAVRCAGWGLAADIVPDAAVMDAGSQDILADAWTLYNAIRSRSRAGTLFAGACRFRSMGVAQPLSTSGGCAAYTLPVTVQLDGYAV